MYSRWYETAVVLLWLATMSWLVTQKVMPTLMVGDPPSVPSMLETRQPNLPIGWSMAWNNRPLGWAVSTTTKQIDGSTKVRSLVHFDELPLGDMVPEVLKKALPPLADLENQHQPMETRHTVVFSPDGKLNQFTSTVQFDPINSVVEVSGVIEGAMLSLAVRVGNVDYETEMRMPPKAVFSDTLSPEINMPGLYEGQRWTVKAYSPLRPPTSPMEILQARVEGVRPMFWDGRAVDTLLVSYRADSGWGLKKSDRPRIQFWVQADGTVLKEETAILGSVMTFVRLGDDAAAELAKNVPDFQQN